MPQLLAVALLEWRARGQALDSWGHGGYLGGRSPQQVRRALTGQLADRVDDPGADPESNPFPAVGMEDLPIGVYHRAPGPEDSGRQFGQGVQDGGRVTYAPRVTPVRLRLGAYPGPG